MQPIQRLPTQYMYSRILPTILPRLLQRSEEEMPRSNSMISNATSQWVNMREVIHTSPFCTCNKIRAFELQNQVNFIL